MESQALQLDEQTLVRIAPVVMPRTTRGRLLRGPLREAVRAFDVTDVADLEDALRSLSHLDEGVAEQDPPPVALATGEGGARKEPMTAPHPDGGWCHHGASVRDEDFHDVWW